MLLPNIVVASQCLLRLPNFLEETSFLRTFKSSLQYTIFEEGLEVLVPSSVLNLSKA